MDPFSLALGVVGLGVQLFGSRKTTQATKEASAAQQRQIQLEQQNEAIRRQTMELDFRRNSLEAVRRQQRARALALNNATTQGASGRGSSALGGGMGQIAGEFGTNLQGLSQSVLAGRQTFDINSQISQSKIQQVQAQERMQEGQAMGQLGSTLINSIGPMKQLTGLQSITGNRTTGNFFMGAGRNWYGG